MVLVISIYYLFKKKHNGSNYRMFGTSSIVRYHVCVLYDT